MNTRDQLRAIVLATIMIVSMVAVGATTVGTVGAQSPTDTIESTGISSSDTTSVSTDHVTSAQQAVSVSDSQPAQVAKQLEDASGETTVILKVDRNIELEGSSPGEFSSEELEQDSEETLQPVVDSVNSLSNAEVTQRVVIGNTLVVEIDLNQHDIDQLATVPGVEAVAPNIKFEHPAQLDESTGAVSPSNVTVPDPDAEYTWGLQQIGVPSFDEQFDVRGEGANVTIIDDGISDGDHPDLEFAQKVNIVDNEINVGAIGVTDNAHGEHVAGTATGALDPAGDVPRYGVAPNASLTKINIFEGTSSTSFANILTAVDYAVTERNADVAGLSLGAGGPSSTVASIVDAQMREAKAAGTLVTVSAGNGGDFFQGGDEGAPVSTPATEFDAFSVGASADQPAVINTTEAIAPGFPSSIAAFTGSNNDITQFSSGAIVSDRRSLDLLSGTIGVGDFYPDDYPRQYVQPDVAAPGLFVLSSGPLGSGAGAPGVNATSDGYSWTQGTSMAQPHVAGAVALIQSATEEDLGPQEISAALTETAEKPDNASEKFPSIGERDIRYGAGIINVTAAALAAQNMTEATGTVTDDAGEPVTGASLETEEGALVRTTEGGEYSLASTESTPNVTVDAHGFDPVTEELTSDDQTFTLDRNLTVTEVVQGQPGTTESGGEFTIVADVASVETFTLELNDSSSFQTGVDERDLTASIAGVGEIQFGQPEPLGNFTGLAEITVSISETADVATGDQLLLDHTFEGSGESVSVTTGPTTLVDAAGAVSSVSIDADFIGTINDQPTTTVTAEGILKDGEPSTGDRLTFTIGGEPVATAVSDGGVATAEVNAEALDLGPQEDVTVDVLEFEAAQTDTVDIVDEVADLEEGFNLLSVPQPATLTTQDVSSLNVWDSEDETYDTVTSPEFDTASDLHDGLYVDASSDNARLGFTFNEDVPVGGTQDVNTDWNLLGANFPLDSEDIGNSTSIENDLTGVDAAALELFRGDFSEFLTPTDEVGPYEAYWAFNPATSADERGIASPSYDEGDRRDVLGQGESDFQPTITSIETTSVEDADDEVTLDDRDVVGASEQVVLVNVTVENTGTGTDVQFVTLEVAPQLGSGSGFELADQTGIELGPGESGDVTLAFVASQDDVSPLPPFFVPDDVAIEVTTEDGDAEDVGIPFDEGGITVEDQALSTDGEFVVENVDVAGHGTVQLVDANDNVLDSVEFAQGINRSVTFTVDDPANVTDDVTVQVLDDNGLEELTSETVDVLDTRFEVFNQAPEFALVNETVDVPVSVLSNVAVPEDNVEVNFSVGGTNIGSQTINISAFGFASAFFPVDTTGLSVGETVDHTATSPDDNETRTLTIAEATLAFNDQSLNADGEVLVEDVTADEGQTIVVTDTDLNVVGEVDVANITTVGERGIDDENVLVNVTGTTAGTHIAHVVADDFTVPDEGPGLVSQQANITVSSVDLAGIDNQDVSEAALPVEVVSSVTVDSEVVDAVGDRNSNYTVEIRQGGTVVGTSDTINDSATNLTIDLDDPVVVDEAQPEQTFTLTAVLVDQNGNEFDVPTGTNLDDDGFPFPVLTGNLDSAADEESFTVTVSGAENVNLPDQALGAANGSDAVLVNNVAADAGQFVVITPADDNSNILGVTQFNETVSGGERIVEFDQEVSAGEFRAHITTDTGLLGDDDALVTDTGSVFNASVTITDQTFVGGTSNITVDSSNLQAEDPANYQIVVHDQTRANSSAVGPTPDDVGPPLGFSGVLTGSESGVPIDLGQSITSTQDVLVMLHFTNPGASGPGGAIPVLNGSAFGFSDGQNGTITDTATVTIEPAPANYELSNLDPVAPVVSPGETFDVSADVTNTGDLAGSQTIELRLDGDVVDTQQAVEVGPGNSTTVTFENVSVGTVGEFTHTVASENDTVRGTLSVANEQVTFDDQSLTADGEVLVTDVTTTTADQQVVITDSNFTVVGQTGDLGVVVQNNINITLDDDVTPGEHIAHIVSNASEADGGPGLVTDRATVVDAEVSVDDVSVNDTDDNTPVTVDEITVQTADVEAATTTNFTVEIRQGGTVIGNSTVLNGTNTDVTVELDEPIEATSTGVVSEQITARLVDENGSAFQIANEFNTGLVPVENDATVTINITEAGANIALPDQALGAANGSDAVFTEDVTGSADQFVVITPADSEEILGSTELSQDVAGEQVIVELDQQIDAGEFRAHLTTETGLLGDGDALVTDTGVVSEAELDFQNQDFVGQTSEVTVATADLLDGIGNTTEFEIAIHQTTEDGGVGDIIGETDKDLTGANSDVTVSLDSTIDTDTTLVAMLHFSDGNDLGSPILQVAGDSVVPVLDSANLTQIESDQTFNDQALTTGEILIQDVRANQTSAVVVTYPNDDNLTIAGLTTGVSSTTGQDVSVTINDTGGFPGEHTAHIIPESDLSQSYSAGNNVSAATADNITSQESAIVFDSSLRIDDQAFEDSTEQVEVNTSDLQPASASDYRIVVHNQTGVPTGDVGPGIGTSADVSGSQNNVTVNLGTSLTTTTDVIAMLHFPDGGAAIPTYDSVEDTFGNISTTAGVVTDAATVEIEQADNGSVEFNDQALSSDSNVTVENVEPVDVQTVGGSDVGVDSFDPLDDFLVLTDGTGVNDGDFDVIDAVKLSNITGFSSGDDVTLNATGASPGTHTVVLHEPNEAGTGPDPDAPRTNASSGEVVEASATVFNGAVQVDNQTLIQGEDNLSQITVATATLDDGAGGATFTVEVEDSTGTTLGNETFTGANSNVTVGLDESLDRDDTDVTVRIEQDGGPVDQATSGASFQNITDTATITTEQGQFDVTLEDINGDGTDASIAEGTDNVDVTANVTNNGDFDDAQNIVFQIVNNGTVVSETVEDGAAGNGFGVQQGETRETTATLQTGSLAPDEYSVNVSSDDDEDSGTLSVQTSNAQVEDLTIAGEGNNAELNLSETSQDITVTINNTGEIATNQTIDLTVSNDSGVQITESQSSGDISSDGEKTIRFSGVVVGNLSADEYDVTVSSADDTATGSLTVLAVEVTSIDIDGQGSNAAIDQGTGPIRVNGTLENFNTVDESRDVTVTITNETGTVLSETDPGFGVQDGQSRTKNFDGLAVGDLQAGDYNVTVATPQTDATGTLQVDNLSVSINDAASDLRVIANETAVVNTTITNEGDSELTQTIELNVTNVSGVQDSQEKVTVGGGNSTTIDLSYQTNLSDDGEDVIVTSEQDSAQRQLAVRNLQAAFTGLDDGETLTLEATTYDETGTGNVTLAANETTITGQGTGNTIVAENVTATGDNSTLEQFTIEGNYTDEGTGNNFTGAEVTSASPGGFIIIEGNNASVNNTQAENVTVTGSATITNSNVSNNAGTGTITVTNSGTATVSDSSADAVTNNGTATLSNSSADTVSGGGNTTIESPDPADGEIFVDNTTGETTAETFSGLENAVNSAAEAATLTVGPGTFDESVTIDVEGLTLEGPNAGIAGDSDARGSEAIITGGSADTPGLRVANDSVTVDGLQIENPGQDGVRFGPDTVPSEATIQNNVITNIDGNTFAGSLAAGNGIQFQFANGAPNGETASNIRILDNEISDVSTPDNSGELTATAINVLPRGNDIDGLEIDGNTISDIEPGTSGSDAAEARGVIVDTQKDDPDRNSASADAAGAVSGLSINDNEFTNLAGDDVAAIALFEDFRISPRVGPENFTITNNEISNLDGTAEAAVFIGGYETLGADHEVSQNVFRDGTVQRFSGAQSGFDPNTADALNLVDNTFTSTDTEVYVTDGTTSDNLNAVLNDNTFDADVSVVGDTAIVPTPGEGEAVTEAGEVFDGDNAIQNAVDAANAGVLVGPGTFTESVTVNTDGLTLEGPNAGIDGDSGERGAEATITEGVDVRASTVTLDGLEVRNPGEQGAADPTDFAGAVGVNIQTDETDVTVENTVLTDIGTNDDDANPIGIYALDGTTGLTVSNNLITDLEGTDEDEGAVQAVLVDESGTAITDVSVTDNTITNLLDTRSTVAVRFNGNVSGSISGNEISDLNTEGTTPEGEPGGFTQVIALQKGGASVTGPSDVTIADNDISNIETTTDENFDPPFHIIVGPNADAGTISIENNDFSADGPDTDVYVGDGTGELDLNAILNDQGNTFDPDGVATDTRIVPDAGQDEVLNANTGERFSSVQNAVENASTGDTIRVGPGTFDENVNIPTDDITLEGAGVGSSVIAGAPSDGESTVTIGQTSNTGSSTSTTGVTVRGFTIDPADDGGFAIETTAGNTQDSDVTIEDNRIEGAAGAAAAAFFQNPDGIEVRNNEFVGPSPENPDFTNTVGDLLVVGSGADDDGDNYVIADNTFEGIVNRDQQPSGGNAIEVRTDGAVTIENNDFTAVSSENGNLIFLADKSTNVTQTGNTGL